MENKPVAIWFNQTPYYIEVACLFRYTYIGRGTKIILGAILRLQ